MTQGAASASSASRSRAQEYRGYEPLLALPDKELGGAAVLGWDARRMRRWLGRLGDPQLSMRCTLVTGSKGKGSTAAFLESILRRAGNRTGLYTQPHLHRYAERIRIAGRMLPPNQSRAGLRAVLAAAPGPVTAFEAATAFCFWSFARAGVREAVLEVGFGGRLDAVTEAEPELVLLVPIEREHADILGPTLADVAGHDLALCRYGRVCLSAPQAPEVARLFAARLREQGIDGGIVPPPAQALGGLSFQLPGGGAVLADPALPGQFQYVNAALAAAGASVLGASHAAIAAGLAATRWPGRLERVGLRPEVIVDGAHTPMSAAAVAQAVGARLGPVGSRPLAVVAGMLADKDVAGFAAPLAALGARIWATEPDHPRALPADRLAAAFASVGTAATISVPVDRAMQEACAWVGSAGLCLVVGSLRVVAEARRRLRPLG